MVDSKLTLKNWLKEYGAEPTNEGRNFIFRSGGGLSINDCIAGINIKNQFSRFVLELFQFLLLKWFFHQLLHICVNIFSVMQ